MTAVWANFDYQVKTRTPYPLYGERQAYGGIPRSNAGSDAVHQIMADFSQSRLTFVSQLGEIHTATRSVGLIDRYGGIFARGVDASAQYGFAVPVLASVFLLLLFIFALLLLVFSTKVRWIDFKDAASQYECGSEQLHVRVTPLTAASFFRMLVVFLIFELEVVILFLAFPMVSLLNPASLIALTVFIFLIQIATVLEVRSGAVRWLRSWYIVPALLSFDNRGLFEIIYPTFSNSIEILEIIMPIILYAISETGSIHVSRVCGLVGSRLRRFAIDYSVPTVCVCLVAVPILLAMPLKEPAVFYF